MNSYLLQRINLYGKLNIELSVNHIQQACCTISLTDEEMFMLDETFTSLLSKTGQWIEHPTAINNNKARMDKGQSNF